MCPVYSCRRHGLVPLSHRYTCEIFRADYERTETQMRERRSPAPAEKRMTPEALSNHVIMLSELSRDERMHRIPPLSGMQIEQLRQLSTATWDGNVVSKSGRDSLFNLSLIDRWNGWQIVNRYGLCVLETLGYLKD